MSFVDIIKKSVVEAFSSSLTTGDIFLSLIIAFICSFIITIIYRKTYMGVSYTKSFVLSIFLLAMVTSLVIRTINSNLALSLGMVGALSIVRFRTAVKDPVDTIFMFWAITVGIMSGAGLYLITIIATLLLGIFYFICYSYNVREVKKYLLVIKAKKSYSDNILESIKNYKNCVVKAESFYDNLVEYTFEFGSLEQANDFIKEHDNKNVENIHLVDV